MSDHFILDAQGEPKPTDLFTWARWLETAGNEMVVRKTKVGEAEVSTVFLGLDHSFGDGPPLLFETLVFGGDHDGEMDRYTTRAQAEAGHEAMVAEVNKKAPPCDEASLTKPPTEVDL